VYLKDLRYLKEVFVYCTRLQTLKLSHNEDTDDSMRTLKEECDLIALHASRITSLDLVFYSQYETSVSFASYLPPLVQRFATLHSLTVPYRLCKYIRQCNFPSVRALDPS